MSDAAQRLERVFETVDMPEPARSQVMLEIARDFADLRHELVGRGMTQRAAGARAARLLLPSAAAADQLVRVHATPLSRLLQQLGGVGGRRGRLAVALVLLVPALVCVVSVVLLGIPDSVPAATLTIGVLMLVAALLAVRVLVRTRFSADSPVAGAATGEWVVLLLGAIMLAIALLAMTLELSAIRGDAAPDLGFVVVLAGRAAEVLAAGLGGALFAGTLWFRLRSRSAAIAAMRAEALALLSNREDDA